MNGKPHWETLGRWDANAGGGTLTVRDAIVKCDERAKAVARGADRKGNTVDPRPERTRPVLHAACVDRSSLARANQLGCERGWVARKAAYAIGSVEA